MIIQVPGWVTRWPAWAWAVTGGALIVWLTYQFGRRDGRIAYERASERRERRAIAAAQAKQDRVRKDLVATIKEEADVVEAEHGGPMRPITDRSELSDDAERLLYRDRGTQDG